ncbi:heat shock protein beta-9 [Conger conger]|uniref:heat shock protein beta-9 n=1 Tax=Conger conger TaxID=82655 RepID=UPI002A59A02E|nr:heat shock protein beta-9 [Conger conger]
MQSSLAESLFAGDPFFERSTVLWPLCRGPLGGVREDFLQRRSALADSFLRELSGLFPYDFLKGGALGSRAGGRPGETRRLSSEGGLELALDVREFGPDDITVKLAGRELAVVAAKRGEEGSARRQGFLQKIGLPDHVDPSAITCSLTPDGLLRIQAPPAAPPAPGDERTVPIRFRTSLNFPVNSPQPDAPLPPKHA